MLGLTLIARPGGSRNDLWTSVRDVAFLPQETLSARAKGVASEESGAWRLKTRRSQRGSRATATVVMVHDNKETDSSRRKVVQTRETGKGTEYHI
jgi:hypothetical protein